MTVTTQVEINHRQVKLTNLDKKLWQGEQGQIFTKYHLIKYYTEIAPFLLPHLKGRPLVVQRFPDGTNKEGFYQKNCPESAPVWINTASFTHEGEKVVHYVLAENLETLIWLGNQGALELHPWLSSLGTLEYPDFAVFDLDPMEASTFNHVRETARKVNWVLHDLGLEGYPKTSGATGLQVYVPVEPVYSYTTVREFVHMVCREVHRHMPEKTTLERKIENRQGKVYLDYLQNVQGKTLVSVYSPRPLKYAPVSVPLEWKEVNPSGPVPHDFNLQNVPDRVRERKDLFKEALQKKQSLSLPK